MFFVTNGHINGEDMPVIQKRKTEKRIVRSYRIREDLIKKIEKIAQEMGESRTYILESLLDYAVEAHEKEMKILQKKQAKPGK
jgi:hypothetical protein